MLFCKQSRAKKWAACEEASDFASLFQNARTIRNPASLSETNLLLKLISAWALSNVHRSVVLAWNFKIWDLGRASFILISLPVSVFQGVIWKTFCSLCMIPFLKSIHLFPDLAVRWWMKVLKWPHRPHWPRSVGSRLIYSLLSFHVSPFNIPPLHLPESLSSAEYLC